MSSPPDRVPTYLAALLRHIQETGIGPGIQHVEIRHDDDCGIFRGKPCDCNPEVETGARVNRKYEDPE